MQLDLVPGFVSRIKVFINPNATPPVIVNKPTQVKQPLCFESRLLLTGKLHGIHSPSERGKQNQGEEKE